MESSKTITIKDSIIIGGQTSKSLEAQSTAEFKSSMEEAREALELRQVLISSNIKKRALYQQIENEAKMVDAKIELMRIEAQKTGERREGELAALDLSRTLNELRNQCVNNESFAVKATVEVLKNKVKDEKSLGYLENIGKMLDALYDDPFRKLEETHQTRILELCNYIEEAYFASLVHGDREK